MRSLVLPKPPKGYNNIPKYLAESAPQYEHMWVDKTKGSLFGEAMLEGFSQSTKHEQMLAHWEIAGVQRWINHGFRAIYPTPEIIEACKHTDVMSSVMGSDIRASIPSFMLVVPKGYEWVNVVGVKASHVVVNIRENEDIYSRYGKGYEMKMPMPSPRYLTVTIFWEDYCTQSSCVPLEEGEQTLGEIIKKYTVDDEHHIVSRIDALLTEEQQKSDRKVGHAIDEFIANALLIMQSYPEYLTTTTHRARGFNTKKMSRQVKVSILGVPSDLRQKVSLTPSDKKDSDGTRTLKTHMRRGHWRRQRHNIQWEADNPEVSVVIMTDGGNAHMVWIRPVMVEGNKE